jgi:hypothetical protein
MEEIFNWQLAYQKEKELKITGDIQGLLDISLDFLNKFGAGLTLQERFPRICYYFGRRNKTDELKLFLSEKPLNFELFVTEELLEFSKNLHFIGLHYPNLSEKELTLLESFYCDSKYYNLIDDILFDQHLLSRPLNKYDSSVREIRQSDFNEELKLEIFNAFIHNDKTDNGEFEEEYYYFYNRECNRIDRKYSREEYEDNVDFLIDFYHLNINGFALIAKEYFGQEFFTFYSKDPIGNGENLEEAEVYSFNSGAYESFQERLLEFYNTNKINTDNLTSLKKHLSNEWLIEINKTK